MCDYKKKGSWGESQGKEKEEAVEITTT